MKSRTRLVLSIAVPLFVIAGFAWIRVVRTHVAPAVQIAAAPLWEVHASEDEMGDRLIGASVAAESASGRGLDDLLQPDVSLMMSCDTEGFAIIVVWPDHVLLDADRVGSGTPFHDGRIRYDAGLAFSIPFVTIPGTSQSWFAESQFAEFRKPHERIAVEARTATGSVVRGVFPLEGADEAATEIWAACDQRAHWLVS